MADLSTKTELKKAFSIQDKTRKIEKVTALYYKIGVKEEAEKRILFHHNAASQILNSLNCTSTSKETLEKLIHQLIDREV
jgi:geranylgeranyl pyrophosphate synthase